MANLTLNKTTESRSLRLLLILGLIIVAAGAAWYVAFGSSSGTSTDNKPADTPVALWESRAVDHYRYTLQVGCFCLRDLTRPVTIEVQDGQVASVDYADDGTAADPELFARYTSIDKLFAIIDEAEAQDPARLDVTYDEVTGVPLSVSIDISEQMADEELYLELSGFEVLPE